MKCTYEKPIDENIVQRCSGEMIDVGEIHTGKSEYFEERNEQGITSIFGHRPITAKLYQCENCKTIQLQ